MKIRKVRKILNKESIIALQNYVREIPVSKDIKERAVKIVTATRKGQNMSVLCYLDVGDTAYLNVQMATGTTGTVYLDDGLGTGNGTNFSGYLIA